MAYSKSNHRFIKKISDWLYSLLLSEFPRWHIVYQPEFRASDIARRNEYLRFYPNGDEHVEWLADAETRRYNYQMSLYFHYYGNDKKSHFEDTISDRREHLYYYLMSKRAEDDTTNGYKWHGMTFDVISPIIWGVEGVEEDTAHIAHVDIEMSIMRTNTLEFSEETVVAEEITIE